MAVKSYSSSKRQRSALDLLAGALTGVAQSPCGHDVHRAPEQVLQVALQCGLLEEAPSVHLHDDVQVAARPGVAASDRPKHPYRRHAVPRGDLHDRGAGGVLPGSAPDLSDGDTDLTLRSRAERKGFARLDRLGIHETRLDSSHPR